MCDFFYPVYCAHSSSFRGDQCFMVFVAEYYSHCVDMVHSVIQSSAGRHFNCFLFLTVMNNAARNFGVQGHIFLVLGCVNCGCNCWVIWQIFAQFSVKWPNCFSKQCTILYSYKQHVSVPISSHSYKNLAFSFLKNEKYYSHINRHEIFHCGLDLHFLNNH